MKMKKQTLVDYLLIFFIAFCILLSGYMLTRPRELVPIESGNIEKALNDTSN